MARFWRFYVEVCSVIEAPVESTQGITEAAGNYIKVTRSSAIKLSSTNFSSPDLQKLTPFLNIHENDNLMDFWVIWNPQVSCESGKIWSYFTKKEQPQVKVEVQYILKKHTGTRPQAAGITWRIKPYTTNIF